ncbi:MAG: nucleotidyl transferase AbiEii/AbiGii toxin family protein [Anaerolineae bacterium]|nr:nucleotidyl transferase AbiEii/AbiGii toxin family protein [Anaerolineae bacterium]
MPDKGQPDLSLFLNILKTLERIDAPYMIIGAFAGTVYGITRVTYDIDMIVDLREEHIEALAAAYSLPRYYADPEMMRSSIEMGVMFNIIDTSRGEKADLVPLTLGYRQAFLRRVRQTVEIPGAEPFDVWCARPDDVILGKLMAWAEGHSRKHEADIFEMLTFHYLGLAPSLSTEFDETYLEQQVVGLGADVLGLWQRIKAAARQEADQAE